MGDLSTFNKKWLLGGVLLIVVAILLAFAFKVFAVEGNPLSLDEFASYEVSESENFFYLKFTAKETFSVEWHYWYDKCIEKPFQGYQKFWIRSPDFSGYQSQGYIIQKDNLEMFKNAGTCNVSETYIAGQTYEVYLINGDELIEPDYTIETIKDICLKEKDENPNVDEETIFTLLEEEGGRQYNFDVPLTLVPEIDIIYPADNSELVGNFTMEINYFQASQFNRLLIGFEDWDASSTCPEIDDPDYQTERDLYFNKQSKLYFSDYFSNATGTTFVEISDIEAGNYNCNMCRFYNDITGLMSDRLCKGYDIKILEYLPPGEIPEYYLPISSWENYYAEHSERFATSTPLFSTLADVFGPLIKTAGNFILFFNNFFDPPIASEKGNEIGNAIPVARGYLETIDDFFGGLPISWAFLFFLITYFVVIILKIIRKTLTTLKP